MSGLFEFMQAVRLRESSDNYQAVNQFNFLGAYQFGEAALYDLGYVNQDGDFYDNNYSGGWTGKNGINSISDFLNSQDAQDVAFLEWTKLLWGRIRAVDDEFYDSQTLNDHELTMSGMIMYSHIVGSGAFRTFVSSGGIDIAIDGNGVPGTEYLELFAGFDLTNTSGVDPAILPAGFVSFLQVHHDWDNTVNGGDGNDILYGFEGDDVVIGTYGNDTLDGGADTDTLDYDQITDSLQFKLLTPASGQLNAVYEISQYGVPSGWVDTATNFEAIILSNQTDVILLEGDIANFADLSIDAGTNTDFVEISPVGFVGQPIEKLNVDGDTLSLEGLTGLTDTDTTYISLDDLDTEEVKDGVLAIGGSTMTLTNFENVLGTAAKDTIYGNESGNGLFGFGGNDVLVGREFSDTLVGGEGDDILTGDFWDGTAFWNDPNFNPDQGDLSYEADQFDDILIGGAGNDIYIASHGDLIVEKSFQDFYSYTNFGSNGDGTVYFNGIELIGGEFVELDDNPIGDGLEKIVDGVPVPRIAVFRDHDNAFLYHVFRLIESVEQPDGSVVEHESYLVAVEDQNKNQIFEIYDFNFTYDALNPSLSTGDFLGMSLTEAAPTDDTPGDDRIRGTKNDDTIIAGEGDDVLDMSDGDDYAFGGSGNDTLKGGKDNDTLEGGSGSDVINGGTGIDTADYRTSSSGVSVSLAGGTGQYGHAAGDTLTSIENISGSSLSDSLYGDSGDNVLTGRKGNDYFEGGGGTDVFDGGSGNDAVGYSSDTTGNVVVDLGAGTFGGNAAGHTYISIESFGGTNNAALGDTLIGSDERNDLYGYDGDDVISGVGGDDLLKGGAGSDTIDGGDGNDWIDGGWDADTLTGGAGFDVFSFQKDYGTATPGAWDVVTDFLIAEDFIDLSEIDADETNGDIFSSPNDGFRWIGTDAFTAGIIGDLRYEHMGGNTQIMGDTDGDGLAVNKN